MNVTKLGCGIQDSLVFKKDAFTDPIIQDSLVFKKAHYAFRSKMILAEVEQ